MMIRHWNDPADQPVLTTGDRQLWLAWLDEETPDDFRGLLSEDECQRAGRLLSPRIADRFRVARGILRILLGRSLARQPESLVFSYGPHGKPDLAGGLQTDLSFNITHSGGLAVFAVAKGFEVGVDVEEIHPISDLESTASIFLTREELAEFAAYPAGVKLERFFTLWTCEEAVLKANGSGFRGPAHEILARFYRPGDNRTGQASITENERLTLFTPAEGYQGALACLPPASKEIL